LTNSLGSITTGNVPGDVTALNSAIDAVAKDLAAGTSATVDLQTLATAETTLATDLATAGTVTRTVRHELRDLTADTKDFTRDVNQVTKAITTVAATLQTDFNALSSSLSTNMMIATDLGALNTAVSAVTADISGGLAASADINKAILAEGTLATDLGATTPAIQAQLNTVATDLLQLAIEAAALKV
jgi:hypothetical protein